MMKKKIKKPSNILELIVAAILAFGGGFAYNEYDGGREQVADPIKIEENNIQTCFTPANRCISLLLKEIVFAKDSIYMQCYGLTSKAIVEQLIKAHQRGVKVRILVDKSNKTDPNSKMEQLKKAGIDITVDHVSGIAHNKVIIIDKRKVLTGSYNFTDAAENRNVENFVIIHSLPLSEVYIQNWLSRKSVNQERF